MEENKSKKSVGVPLILIIVLLIISIACCIVYISKLNNEIEQLEQKTEVNNGNITNNSNFNSDQVDNKNDISNEQELNKAEKEYIKVFNVGEDFEKLSNVGKLIWDYENDKEVEYDLNNDGVKEKIYVKDKEDYKDTIIINGNELNEERQHKISELYLIDFNINDQTTELIGILYGDSGAKYYRIYTYNKNELRFIKQLNNTLFINNKGVLINDCNLYANIALTKKYYTYNNGNLNEINVDLENLSNQEFIIEKSKDFGPYYTYNQDIQEAISTDQYYIFKEDTKVRVIDFNTDIIEAKLENGKTIYIFPHNGYLAG